MYDNKWDIERHSQTQLSGRFRLVITSILPAARDIGIAQHTTRGVARPLLLLVVMLSWGEVQGVERDGMVGWVRGTDV